MFDKLEDLLIRFEELMSELSEPDVACLLYTSPSPRDCS